MSLIFLLLIIVISIILDLLTWTHAARCRARSLYDQPPIGQSHRLMINSWTRASSLPADKHHARPHGVLSFARRQGTTASSRPQAERPTNKSVLTQIESGQHAERCARFRSATSPNPAHVLRSKQGARRGQDTCRACNFASIIYSNTLEKENPVGCAQGTHMPSHDFVGFKL